MSNLKPMQRFVWVDIETTGLDKEEEVLLEVGFKITNLDLVVQNTFQMTVWMPNYLSKIDNAVPLVTDMHTKNGLFEECSNEGSDILIVEQHINNWLWEHEITSDDPLCGSSVQFDREWLSYLFPKQMAFFSHRNIDISSVKELCRRFNPVLYGKMEEDTTPKKLHRVHHDLMDTIAEAYWYKENFLWVA